MEISSGPWLMPVVRIISPVCSPHRGQEKGADPLAAFQDLKTAAPASERGTDAVVNDFPIFFFQNADLTVQGLEILFDFSKHVSAKSVKEENSVRAGDQKLHF